MRKYRLFFTNISKEEAWINQITAQGYRLKKIAPFLGQYTFEEHQPIAKNSSQEFSNTETFFPQAQNQVVFNILNRHILAAMMRFFLIPPPEQVVIKESPISVWSLSFYICHY